MLLRVIGSSPSWPNADEACSGYLLELEAGRLLIDCGPGVLSRLRALGGQPPRAIVLSHLHADHCADLLALGYGHAFGPLDWGRPALHLPTGGRALLGRAFAGWREALDLLDGVVEIVEDGTAAVAVGASLAFAPADHVPEARAIRVEDAGRSFVFTGDGAPSAPVADLASGADLLLAEATWLEPRPAPGVHSTARDAAQLALRAGVGRLLLTHLAAESRDAALAEARSDLEAVELALGGSSYEV